MTALPDLKATPDDIRIALETPRNRMNPDRMTIFSLSKKIQRIVAYLYQLQESIKPDKTFIISNIIMFILTAVINIVSYFGFEITSLVLNFILLAISVIMFIYALYGQLAFNLQYKETGGKYVLLMQGKTIGEIKIIEDPNPPKDTIRGNILRRTNSVLSF